MIRSVFWRPLDEIGLEHLWFERTPDWLRADGFVLQTKNALPFRLLYRIETASDWSMRSCVLAVENHAGVQRRLDLRVNERGEWHDAATEQDLSQLAGCREVDIQVTPFTNSLPIGRLKLRPGETRDIKAAYIEVPELIVSPAPQRYTALAQNRFRYEGLQTAFAAELSLDADGLVLDYPGVFMRVESQLR
jgi:uncharacterized protein